MTITKPPYYWETYTEVGYSTIRFHLDYDDHNNAFEIVTSNIKSFKLVTDINILLEESTCDKNNIAQYFNAPTGEFIDGRIAKDFVLKLKITSNQFNYTNNNVYLELETDFGKCRNSTGFNLLPGIYVSDLSAVTKDGSYFEGNIAWSASPDMWFTDFDDHNFELYLFADPITLAPTWMYPPIEMHNIYLSSIRIGGLYADCIDYNIDCMLGSGSARQCIYTKYKLDSYGYSNYNSNANAALESIEIGSATFIMFNCPILINPNLYR